MNNVKSFEDEKLQVFDFFYKYQDKLSVYDIETIFTTLDYDFFQKLESYVKFEREINFPVDDFDTKNFNVIVPNKIEG